MSFNRRPFKSVQSVSINSTVANGTIVLPTPVDPAHTMVIWGGNNSFDGSGFPCGMGSAIFHAVDANHLYFTNFGLGGGFNLFATVVEFYGYQLRQAVQYGIGFMNGVGFVDTAITPVSSKGFVCFLGMCENKAGVQTDMASLSGTCLLINGGTAVRCQRAGTGGVNAPDQASMGFCVVDPF